MRAMETELQRRLLERAVAILGGQEALSAHLGVEPHSLSLWVSGRAGPPAWVAELAIDIVLEDDVARAMQDRRESPRTESML